MACARVSLTVNKGRIYYYMSLNCAPREFESGSINNGFAISRYPFIFPILFLSFILLYLLYYVLILLSPGTLSYFQFYSSSLFSFIFIILRFSSHNLSCLLAVIVIFSFLMHINVNTCEYFIKRFILFYELMSLYFILIIFMVLLLHFIFFSFRFIFC
jgi:hypothetical protein